MGRGCYATAVADFPTRVVDGLYGGVVRLGGLEQEAGIAADVRHGSGGQQQHGAPLAVARQRFPEPLVPARCRGCCQHGVGQHIELRQNGLQLAHAQRQRDLAVFQQDAVKALVQAVTMGSQRVCELRCSGGQRGLQPIGVALRQHRHIVQQRGLFWVVTPALPQRQKSLALREAGVQHAPAGLRSPKGGQQLNCRMRRLRSGGHARLAGTDQAAGGT